MAYVYFIAHTDGTFERKVTKSGTKHIDLEELQEAVGGFIEIVRPVNFYISGCPYLQRIRMIINENGKWEKLPVNKIASTFYQPASGDYIVGDVVFTIFDAYPEPDCVAISDLEEIEIHHFSTYDVNFADNYAHLLHLVNLISGYGEEDRIYKKEIKL